MMKTIISRGRLGEPSAESGQALVEYALILGLVAVVSIAGLTALGTNVNAIIQGLADTIGAS